MITVRLATTPTYLGSTSTPQSLGTVSVSLEALPSFASRGRGTLINRFKMPPPSSVISPAVAPSDMLDEILGSAVFRIVVECGADSIAVVVGPVGQGDIFSLIGGQAPPGGGGRNTSLYVGSIVHTKMQGPNPCGVRCDLGPVSADECCIVCTSGLTTVKFCC